MRPKILLRISSVIMLLHLIGHSMGAFTWKQAPNPAVGRVIAGMEQEHFDFVGKSVTLASFFTGYGFINIFILLLLICLLWLLSTSSDRRLLWPITFYLFAQAILEFVYFFPLPAIMSLVAAILSALALYYFRKSPNPINT
jgi:hypothetical protein